MKKNGITTKMVHNIHDENGDLVYEIEMSKEHRSMFVDVKLQDFFTGQVMIVKIPYWPMKMFMKSANQIHTA
jgi:hypothetical protein